MQDDRRPFNCLPQVLKASGYRRMPWKNGGGETVEIAVFPPHADLATFGWRISMATVARDGPFSVFKGIDRTLSILNGQGMELDVAGEPPVALTKASLPFAFPADAPTYSRLVSGAVADLNVMTRRGQWVHQVERLAIDGQHRPEAKGGITMLLALGNLRIDGKNREAELGRLDCAILTDDVLVTSPIPTDAYLIRITEV